MTYGNSSFYKIPQRNSIPDRAWKLCGNLRTRFPGSFCKKNGSREIFHRRRRIFFQPGNRTFAEGEENVFAIQQLDNLIFGDALGNRSHREVKLIVIGKSRSAGNGTHRAI